MPIDIQTFKTKPIPAFAPAFALMQGFRQDVKIDISHDLFNEDLQEVRDVGIAGTNHYFTAANPPYFEKVPGAIESLFVRESVLSKLIEINTALQTQGIELYLFDGWRPQAIQRYFHGTWFPQWLREHRPEIPEEKIMEEVELYWAPPSDGENSPSPHSTGGAVDLSLRFVETKQPLYMGGIFDDLTDNAHADWFERSKLNSMSDIEAQANRRILYWTMDAMGFAHNPTEWWHFSFGDQLWAKLKSQPAALYGGIEKPS